MKRVIGLALAAAAVCAFGSPAKGQYQTPETRVQQAQIRLEQAKASQVAVKAELQQVQRLYNNGTTSQAELSNAEGNVSRAQGEVSQAEVELKAALSAKEQSDRLESLRRPVSVELRDAPVRQAATVLSHASGVPISVDKNVPADKRLTVVAQDVPLATVLGTVARQVGLQIAPEGGGVLLKPAPALEVNGQRAELMSPFAPWSIDWGVNPGMQGGSIVQQLVPVQSATVERGGTSVYAAPGLIVERRSDTAGPEAQARFAPPPAGGSLGPPPAGAPGFGPPPGYGAPPAMAPAPGFGGPGGFGGDYGFVALGPPPVTMTALSSTTFVVASPAPGNEAAVLLTVYRLEGTSLRKISSTVQPLGNGTRIRTRMGMPEYGAPGGFGGGFGGYGGFGAGARGSDRFGAGGYPGSAPKAAPSQPPGNPLESYPGSPAPRPDGAVPRDNAAPQPAPDTKSATPPAGGDTAPEPAAAPPAGAVVPPPAGRSGEVRGDRLMVLGAVQRPGVYRPREGWRVSDALGAAGGVVSRAELAGVKLWHNGEPRTLDLSRFRIDNGSELNPQISPGDVLEVPLLPAILVPASSPAIPDSAGR